MLPFLRIKKPQSPFLSRVLDDKIKQRQKRNNHLERLCQEKMWAEGEELWDDAIGVKRGPNEVGWVDAPTRAVTEISRNMRSLDRKNLERQRLYWEIVQKEKQLAVAEKVEKQKVSRLVARWGGKASLEPETRYEDV